MLFIRRACKIDFCLNCRARKGAGGEEEEEEEEEERERERERGGGGGGKRHSFKSTKEAFRKLSSDWLIEPCHNINLGPTLLAFLLFRGVRVSPEKVETPTVWVLD